MADLRTLLIRYLQGKCSPDEVALLKKWIHSEEGERILEEIIEQRWGLPDENTSLESDKLYERIQQQIHKKKPAQIERPMSESHIGRYAASLIFILLSVVFLFHYLKKEQTPVHEVLTLTKETQKGQKRTINLTDGTRIVLNAESKIAFPEHFSDTLRTVYLSGEAFFDVAEDKNRPFIVQTPSIHIQVLGTSFNLSAYDEDSLTRVALLHGKVTVQYNETKLNKPSLVLKPGEMATYHKAKHGFTTGEFDLKAMSGWKDGILYFKNAGYDEIIQTLERWYDVQFIYKGKGKRDWLYNGEFDDKSLEYVLESISYACEFSYKLQDKQVIINNL